MPTARHAAAARWLIAAGAAALFVALFLTWSRQVTGRALRVLGRLGGLQGVSIQASAWQVYTMADVLLALLAGGLIALAVVRVAPAGPAWLIAMLAVLGALAFVVHALAVPPTNGLLLVHPAGTRSTGDHIHYVWTGARAGAGEVAAIAGLAVALIGLAVSGVAALAGSRGTVLDSNRVDSPRRSPPRAA